MRIKAVLRDTEILQMEAGSKVRILAALNKNIDRLVNLSSLLKVMGLAFNERVKMLEALSDTRLHAWFANDADQDLILTSRAALPADMDICTYQWQ
jgi:division protein CdvB (Snf7/Vps24/ESCRT-III family)